MVWILTDRRYLRQRMPLALVRWLSRRGHAPSVVVAEDRAAAGRRIRGGDLVVTRSRDPRALALLEEAEARGARALDPYRAVQRVRDKLACARALEGAGLPVPRTMLVAHPDQLTSLPDSAFPLIVKPVLGDNARGVRMIATRDEVSGVDWSGEPMLAQAWVDAGGLDIKLYVAGDRVWATRRPSPLLDADAAPVPLALTPDLHRIADGCRATFGLTFFGADVLRSADGLAIVDVNEFPNYTGVEGAPQHIGELILAELGVTQPHLG